MIPRSASLKDINIFLKRKVCVLKTIYVGNLEWKTSVDELKDFFSPYGQVTSANIITDRETGQSRGFGFVTMENADQAIEELNGKEFRGRALKINEAQEKPKGGRSDHGLRPSFRPKSRESFDGDSANYERGRGRY